MLILSFETSCDETAAAVTRDGRCVLSDEILSQCDRHALYGGVVPEIASRAHVEAITGLADLALRRAGVGRGDIGAIAVTYAPGLIGALLAGVSFAKGAAFSLGVPLVPVHHIAGHIAANYIAFPELAPPFVCLIVSGGNSLIADVRGYTDIRVVGRTRDDAAGECFDKVARALGLGYPGGALLDELARSGNDRAYKLPRAAIEGSAYDMSFSGVKSAAINIINGARARGEQMDKPSLAASLSAAISDALVPRVMSAARLLGYGNIAIAGGVAANARIRKDFERAALECGRSLYMPPAALCGDNAAMIGCQGYYEFLAGTRADMSLNAQASLEL
ncbi:MAG: tRNA (adenosine(37)-N6)-threonylcarbamoyltransferase complex transferase subunit TsaD [Oscillospiraceae bacterium]|jgi:N6-L-threonylcarbamoyladenine synthase|nr:tRNA (adenosine(37)-N6)-threonylcarbamoyltransferase complex transferase subunit TsaD [Oscillospiraceae bacterium]